MLVCFVGLLTSPSVLLFAITKHMHTHLGLYKSMVSPGQTVPISAPVEVQLPSDGP